LWPSWAQILKQVISRRYLNGIAASDGGQNFVAFSQYSSDVLQHNRVVVNHKNSLRAGW
jgi:hypothetical protein